MLKSKSEHRLHTRDQILKDLCDRVLQAQANIKSFYDAHHCDIHSQVSNNVLLCLHPYHQFFLARSLCQKIVPKVYGPFHILEQIGSITYRLPIPKIFSFIKFSMSLA